MQVQLGQGLMPLHSPARRAGKKEPGGTGLEFGDAALGSDMSDQGVHDLQRPDQGIRCQAEVA